MFYSDKLTNYHQLVIQIPTRQFLFGLAFILIGFLSIYAQTEIATQPDEQTLIVNDAPEMEVYSFGKNVIIQKEAKGVLVFGGNVTVEGRVTGDVAAIGGTIIQKKDAYIGGDVIVFGGTYRPESPNPLRNAEKETVMIAMFEDEIRNFTQNPAQIFSPSFSLQFFAQRLLSMLFWFIISMALTTIAPGAVSRSVARFQLTSIKVLGIGLVGFLLTTIAVVGSLSFLPNYVSAILIPMAFILLLLSYVFGRVALQVSLGKQIQKRFFPENKHSETLAILIGVLIWTVFLSLPYLWMVGLFVLISASVGLVLTARSEVGWKNT
ncbi:MAG: polymer-forming cytoskeletal protein [Pyrinomonadaceae bacterium]